MDSFQWKLQFPSIVDHSKIMLFCSAMQFEIRLFRVYIESLTMFSQEPPKKKSKRDNRLFCLYRECTCINVMYFVPVYTSAYHMEKHKTYKGSEQ